MIFCYLKLDEFLAIDFSSPQKNWDSYLLIFKQPKPAKNLKTIKEPIMEI